MVLPREIAHAAQSGDLDTVRQFVESSPERINEAEQDGYFNLILIAISSCQKTLLDSYADSAQLVRYLISRGADVECRSRLMSPLECACSCSHTEAVALLLRAGANVNRRGVCVALFNIAGFEHHTERERYQVTDRIFECLCHLLRAGHALDVLYAGTTTPLEQIIEDRVQSLYSPGHLGHSLNLVRTVRASMYTSASSRLSPWRQFVLAPSVAVLRLRSLAARGRAHEVTWDRPGSRSRARGRTPRPIAWLLDPHTPNDIVWNVLAFWNPRNYPWEVLGAV